ncbi:hypothetical protein HK103_004047 [Boothiomyces macroporosus]|uniref:Chitin-binding type-4 domain-containing protein n=1 Tax=Boothiomyces macroporosus TaxID=261099 RepID=A0AAD5UJP0_9FUNG|nr:hypothetical protein HK103_004047 [Boothiomyces macroporosus]
MIFAQAVLFNLVNGHGFLVHPGPIEDAKKYHAVRNYDAISTDISSLRNPDATRLMCRGAPKGPVTPITLQNGQPFTVTCAFSINAFHVGPCSVDIIDADNPNSVVEIGSQMGCARPPFAKVNTDGMAGHPATSICPDAVPADLITNDMCLSEWTFTVQNADQIKCKNCILRWNWEGRHISTPGEFYQNCADVDITVIEGGQVNGKGPILQDLAAPSPVVNSLETLNNPVSTPTSNVIPANLPPLPIIPAIPTASESESAGVVNIAAANLPPNPVVETSSIDTIFASIETECAQPPQYTIKDSSSDFETVTPQVTLNYPATTENLVPTRAIYVSGSLQLASGILTALFIILALLV